MTHHSSQFAVPRLGSRRRLYGSALAACLAFCAGSGAMPADQRAAPPAASRPDPRSASPGAESFVRAGSFGEILSRWRPEIHLYTLGDVGLSEGELAELAAWIGDRHWTVLLVRDASGQAYTDLDGIERHDADAIDFGAGQGIAEQARFLAQVHPRTQEPDGAILSILLEQRALFYAGSVAQDSRGLGEDRFAGNLDRWAITAMRSGGDVVGAVKGTVTGIDAELDAAIRREQAAATARLEAAQRALDRAEASLKDLEIQAESFRQAHPAVRGPISRPDLPKLRENLAAARSLSPQDPGRAFQAAQAVQDRAKAAIDAIGQYPGTGQSLDAAEARLAGLAGQERADAARKELLAARQELAKARDLYASATPGYTEGLAATLREIEAAENRISAAGAAAASRRTLFRFLLGLLAATLLLSGLLLNRGRRGVKAKAEQLLAAWRAALDKKLEILIDELERRVVRFVGPATGEGRLPYSGETLRLAGQIRADVGSLYILWTSASSVLQKAAALIEARRLGAVANFFFPGKYRQGIALLEHEPVPFDPAEGLPRLFGQERTWQDDLLGDLASYEPFRKSFQEIVAELDARAARATAALARIESSVTQGPSALAETAETIRQTEARHEEVRQAGTPGTTDGLFLVPAVFAAALPAAAATLARARSLFPTDPVAALQGDGALALRIAEEAAQLAGLALAGRSGVLPAIEGRIAALRAAAVETGWIETERLRLSGRADLLAQEAAEAPVAAGIEEVAQGLADLGARAEHAVALAKVLDETARPEIRRIAGLVRTARADLGAALGLSPERLLREEELDPSVRLEGAAGQCDAVQAALGRGALGEAEAGLDEADRLATEAEEIVEATRQAFAAHAATVDERRAETGRVEALLPDHDRILAEIGAGFAPSVLILRSDDPEHPEDNAHLGDNLDEARLHVGLAHEKLGRALAAHRDGRLLASAQLLGEVREHQEFAVHRLEEVAERQARLERTLEANRNLLEALEARVREGQLAVAGDPRAMRPTLDAFEGGRQHLQQARRSVEAVPGDPLVAEDELLAAQALLVEAIDRLAPRDRLLHAEARKSVEAAERQLAAAAALARRAATDNIPDSTAITEARRTLESLSEAQARAREALGVEHGDWNALDAEADRIAAEAARRAASLSGEIAAGEQALASFTQASERVRQARTWSGSYGIAISGQPGAASLSQAKTLLEVGRYREAEQEAVQAYQAAASAIAEAEQRVRRETERRREERRRRERASFSSSSSTGSRSSSSSIGRSSPSGGRSTSFGSGRSSGGSSSGSGRSSWGGGGRSGSGRSGW